MTKWGVCSECGYRITESDKDQMESVGGIDKMDFVHGRCYSE